MDRLKLVLLFSAVFPTLSGAFVIAVMSLGYYTWPAILGAALVGLLSAWPASRYVSRRIKREDPGFDHTREKDSDFLPHPNAREV
jgi:uncharacterized membrane protein YfcA